MLKTCPQCNSDNNEDARFCDQCGAALEPTAAAPVATPAPAEGAAPAAPAAAPMAAPAASSAAPQINWAAVIFILAAVGGLFWLLGNPGTKDNVAPGMSGGGSNPAAMMGQIQGQIKDLKGKLDKEPSDTAALKELYTMYAQVGKLKDVGPYLEKALAAIEKKEASPETRQQIAELAETAMGAGDNEGLLLCLTSFNRLFPEELGALAYIADVHFKLGQLDQSIDYYNRYLEKATPEKEGAEYWDVVTSRGSTYVEQYKKNKNKSLLDQGLAELVRSTNNAPKSWSGWYYLGLAQLTAEDKTKARESFTKAVEAASDKFQAWEAQAEIDKLDGKEPAPMPNPHGEGFGTAAGASPHGEMPADDAHSGAGSAPSGEMPNDSIHGGGNGGSPHGEPQPSPHGESSDG
jgi:tetratricopeptide (TPR) repeat protein